jgi:type IV pilus assembly protein PilW
MTMHRLMGTGAAKRQRGLTLIEFMVSIVLGMLMVAAIATLIANQSTNRSEIDRAGKMIENGRYAVQTITEDLQLAGYWGQIGSAPAAPAALPNPCSALPADVTAAMGAHVQGYDGSTSLPLAVQACVSNQKAGTDVLVVRHADPTTMVTNVGLLSDGQLYLQTGLTSVAGAIFNTRMYAGLAASNVANFPLVTKAGTLAPIMKVVTRIYYVATCDVCTGLSADAIPTLKRVEVGPAAATTVAIAEGIENLQVDYGLDTLPAGGGDGSPDGSDTDASTIAFADWANVMSVKVFIVARATDPTPGFTDTKSYVLGASFPASAPFTAASGTEAYRRHTFVQSVRLVNPSGRRAF